MSDHDDSDDNSAYGDDGQREFSSNYKLNPGTRSLNLSPQYVADWTGKHAYREILQNQIDAILESFNVTLEDLRTFFVKCEKERRIEIRIVNRRTSKLCGFQVFTYDKDGFGILKVCNRDAWLCDKNFDLGGTTKRNKSNQAGKHGEGFKVGALVLRRHPNNFSVRITSSDCYVNFNFNKYSNLIARITRIKDGALEKEKARFAKQNLQSEHLEPRSWQDVCWEIGVPRKCQVWGASTWTSKIPLAQFEEWLTVTTIIRPPQNMIRTPHGNLIFDASLSGKLFLRGLELPCSSASGKDFRYAYDLMKGSTGRDRTSLSNAHEESRNMAKIWKDAILCASSEEDQSKLLTQYYDMVELDRTAEVHEALRYMPKDIIAKLWAQLLNKAKEWSPAGFYHGPEQAEEHAQVIRRCLRQTPIALARSTWDILKHHDLCRTPHAEREHRFRDLPPILISELSSFGVKFLRLLKACLLSDPATSDKEIVIVDGGSLDVRAYYKRDSKLWGIEKKLLEIETAHEGIFYCEAMQMHDDEEDDFSSMFCCMHAVVDLFGSVLEDLDEEDLNQPSAVAANAKRKHLISMARTRTSRVVQNVMVAPTDRGGQLKVGWESLETNYARKRSTFSYAVTLHKEGRCKDKSQYLIQTPDSRKLCGCEAVQVPLHQDQHVFTDLDAGNGYFVTICHDDAVAIYATLFNKCEIEAAPVMEEEESPGLMPRESDALPSTEMEPPLSNAGYARASINCSSTTRRSELLDDEDPDSLYRLPTPASYLRASDPPMRQRVYGGSEHSSGRRHRQSSVPGPMSLDEGTVPPARSSPATNTARSPTPEFHDTSSQVSDDLSVGDGSIQNDLMQDAILREGSARSISGSNHAVRHNQVRNNVAGDRLAHEAPVRDAQDGPVEYIPMDMEKLNLAEIMRRRWYEGQPDGPEEGVWMGIPKEEDGGEGTMEESTDERPTKRRRLLRDTR